MANKTLNMRIVMRNDTAENWTSKNPVLLNGEFGVENDSRKFKIGDGTTAWTDLAYSSADESVIKALNENVFEKSTDGTLSLLGFADAVGGAQLVKTEDGKVSWIKPDTTTVEGLSTAIESLKTTVGDDKSGLVKKANDNETAISVLNGDSTKEGSVAYQIAQIVAGADESYDTLKEIADWIKTHGTEATAMNAQIEANKNDIAALKTQTGTEPIADQISTAIDNALKVDGVDKYAPASSAHEHANKTVLDTITEDKVAAWDDAQANVIESIKLNGVAITPAADKSVDVVIPAATNEVLGLAQADGVTIDSAEGVFSVKAISTDMLMQGTDELIINGGNA